MSSPLVLAMNQISADFEAATPPSNTTVTYHEVSGKDLLEGTAGDRSFWFLVPVQNEVIGEYGNASSSVEWLLPVNLRITSTGKNRSDFIDACANETVLLRRAIDKRSTWPAAVLEVVTDDVTAEQEAPDSDAIYTFNVRILCQESD